MAYGGDGLHTGPGGPLGLGRAAADRERFLAFALTAADMLLEVSPEGRIEFAAGAFLSRLGEPPEAWIGRPAEVIVSMPDRASFDGAFSALLARDRLPPTPFRLPDAAGTPVSVAGLRLPAAQGSAGRFCLTVSSLPKQPFPARPALAGGDAVRDAALRLAGTGAAQALSFIEVAGPDGRFPQSGPVAALVGEALSSGLGTGCVAGELSDGRYGIVSAGALDLAGLGEQIRDAVRGAGLDATLETRSVPLGAEGLTPVQRTRALRYALDAFARGGHPAMEAAGFAAGLSGFVERACSRADALRLAIAGKRFGLAFQPIVRMEDGVVEHYEALLRPDTEVAAEFGPPGDFVALAETLAMSDKLDWAVVEAASAAARRGRGARIAANLSGLSLQSPAFRARLLQLLDGEPMLASRLMVEITETAEIEDEEEAVRTIAALRERGMELCIDDFGAGAAAFRYLRAFRVDMVKIDGRYLRDAMRGEQDRAILASMVGLIRTVGARIVSERIETEAEAALVRNLGADLGQGWLYGRPGCLPS
ncbi:MAG: EAL domain-containing protein [Acetobacteraceae bacterium]|nr:EAL domain-containing protein [Acetobacteraceae bacterium]